MEHDAFIAGMTSGWIVDSGARKSQKNIMILLIHEFIGVALRSRKYMSGLDGTELYFLECEQLLPRKMYGIQGWSQDSEREGASH